MVIDREKVIKGLEVCIARIPGEYTCTSCPYEIDGNDCEINLSNDALILLREQEPAPTVGGWVSIRDRLPEKKQLVMVSLVNEIDGHRMKRPQLGYPADDAGVMWYIVPWNEWAVDSDFEVTHWMPIPEPPEEVRGDAAD